MSAEDAFGAYEAVRHRLPKIAPNKMAYRRAETLEDLADAFDVFFLDAFGVLNIGEAAIPDAPQRVRALQAAGKRVLVVSNAAGAPHQALMQKYQMLGYDFDPADVITSRATLRAALADAGKMHWGAMAASGAGLDDLHGMQVSYLQDDPGPYRDVDGFLLIGSAEWTASRQELLESALAENPRPVWVGNPDIVAPREFGFSTEPGHFAHQLADRTGVAPKFFGKPFANIFDLAFARVGNVAKSDVLMVGDSLHTDILGARQAGIASALIADYGFFAGQDVDAAISRAQISPDFLVRRP